MLGIQEDLNQKADINGTFETIEVFFVATFAVELCLKLFGFGLCCFFSDKWNVADFVMVSIAVGEICMVRIMYEPGNSDGINASTIRLLRILRVFRMASIFDRLSLLIHAFICAVCVK